MTEQTPDGWQPPGSAGEVGAVQSIGTIAAPFLAGFSITLVGVIVATAKFAHRGIAELLLTGAALLMVGKYSVIPLRDGRAGEYLPPAPVQRVQVDVLDGQGVLVVLV